MVVSRAQRTNPAQVQQPPPLEPETQTQPKATASEEPIRDRSAREAPPDPARRYTELDIRSNFARGRMNPYGPDAGRPDRGPDASTRRDGTVRFNEAEHREFGEVAAKKRGVGNVRLAHGLEVSYGDIVAMAGDYFEDVQQLRDIAFKEGPGAGTRQEIEYILQVKIRGGSAQGFPKDVVDAVEKRYFSLATNNARHFQRPRMRDAKMPAHRRPDSAGRAYRSYHRRALAFAIKAGQHGDSLNHALSYEAFGGHFLTDSVSSGHIRTPRIDVETWWDARDPGLDQKFRGYFAAKISEHILKKGGPKTFVAGTVLSEVRKGVDKALAGKPKLTMGALVGMALHDSDNRRGLAVESNGKKTRVVGDGFRNDPNTSTQVKANTRDLAVKAVDAGIQELQDAYRLGAANPDADPKKLFERMQGKDGLFAAERLIPKEDSAAHQPSPVWRVQNPGDLLRDPRMRAALSESIREKLGEIRKVAEGMEEPGRSAVLQGFLPKVERDPIQALKEILAYDGSLDAKLIEEHAVMKTTDYPF